VDCRYEGQRRHAKRRYSGQSCSWNCGSETVGLSLVRAAAGNAAANPEEMAWGADDGDVRPIRLDDDGTLCLIGTSEMLLWTAEGTLMHGAPSDGLTVTEILGRKGELVFARGRNTNDRNLLLRFDGCTAPFRIVWPEGLEASTAEDLSAIVWAEGNLAHVVDLDGTFTTTSIEYPPIEDQELLDWEVSVQVMPGWAVVGRREDFGTQLIVLDLGQESAETVFETTFDDPARYVDWTLSRDVLIATLSDETWASWRVPSRQQLCRSAGSAQLVEGAAVVTVGNQVKDAESCAPVGATGPAEWMYAVPGLDVMLLAQDGTLYWHDYARGRDQVLIQNLGSPEPSLIHERSFVYDPSLTLRPVFTGGKAA